MTAEELAAIDAWLGDLEPGCDGWYIETRLVRALRDEVERLRSGRAALVEIARAVAMGQTVSIPADDVWVLLFANHTLSYAQSVWHNARTLMADEPSQGGMDKPGASA